MTILHNCALSDDNLKYFYEGSDTIKVIAWYAHNISLETDVGIHYWNAIKFECAVVF